MCSPDKACEYDYLVGMWIVLTAFFFSPLWCCVFQEMKELWKQFLWIEFIREDRDSLWEPWIVMEVGAGKGASWVVFQEDTKQWWYITAYTTVD